MIIANEFVQHYAVHRAQRRAAAEILEAATRPCFSHVSFLPRDTFRR